MAYPEDSRGLMQHIRDLLANGIAAVLGAGSAIIGKVGIDQTAGQNVVTGPGTAGTPAAGVVSVQGVASMTPLLTAPAASATGGYSFLSIPAGQATTVVKASAGTLHSIVFNSAATATNTTSVYDNATGVGTIIAKPNAVAATVPNALMFDLAFANGLTIITAAANGGDMTVTYK